MIDQPSATYLRYVLRLRAPVIMSTLAGDPNGAATQPFVPGSAVRGAVAARLLARGETGDGDTFKRLILSGAVRYLHAYPRIAEARALPVPLSWKCDKHDPASVQDLASVSGEVTQDTDAEDFAEAWPATELVAVGGSFVAPSVANGARQLVEPIVGSRVHHQRDRVHGRPWRDGRDTTHGAVFTYEYLKDDQEFAGVVQLMPSAVGDVERIKGLLDRPILLGRSRRAGYGGEAVVSGVGVDVSEYPAVSERIRTDVAAGSRIRVLLTSAYVGRHSTTGQSDPAALEHELVGALAGAVRVERRRWAFETVGGFNRKWGMELPQVIGVRAGSVLVLGAQRPVSLGILQCIEDEGLGERRAEGFGRVLFLQEVTNPCPVRLRYAENPAPPEVPRSPERAGNPQLEFLESRLVLNAARAELERVARLDIASRAKGEPTNALIGRMRAPLRGCVDQESAERALRTVSIWCSTREDALEEPARAKLQRCSLVIGREERSLLEWLSRAARAGGDSAWATLIDATGAQASVTALAERSYLSGSVTAQAILEKNASTLLVGLIDAVLASMAQRNRGGAA